MRRCDWRQKDLLNGQLVCTVDLETVALAAGAHAKLQGLVCNVCGREAEAENTITSCEGVALIGYVNEIDVGSPFHVDPELLGFGDPAP